MRVSFPCCDCCVHADAVSETTAPFRGPSGFAAEVAFKKSEADNCFVESCKMIGVAGASDSAMFSVFIFVSEFLDAQSPRLVSQTDEVTYRADKCACSFIMCN